MKGIKLYKYNNKEPNIDPTSFIAPNASIIGDVTIGPQSSIWFNTVIRGDVARIEIGNKTNIQDGTVIHVGRDDGPTIIEDEVTIGHKALLHACHIKTRGFIGMGAIIMDNVIVETDSMVAAGSLVTKGKYIKSGELWAGSPAKFLRKLSQQEIEYIKTSADNYAIHTKEYIEIFKNTK